MMGFPVRQHYFAVSRRMRRCPVLRRRYGPAHAGWHRSCCLRWRRRRAYPCPHRRRARIEGEAGGTENEGGCIRYMRIAGCNDRLFLRRQAFRCDRDVQPRDGSIQHIRHEDMRVITLIVHSQIPGTIQELPIGPSLHEQAVPIDYLQGTLTYRGDGAIRGGYVTNDDEARVSASPRDSRSDPSHGS
jgi:hypothetical protein